MYIYYLKTSKLQGSADYALNRERIPRETSNEYVCYDQLFQHVDDRSHLSWWCEAYSFPFVDSLARGAPLEDSARNPAHIAIVSRNSSPRVRLPTLHNCTTIRPFSRKVYESFTCGGSCDRAELPRDSTRVARYAFIASLFHLRLSLAYNARVTSRLTFAWRDSRLANRPFLVARVILGQAELISLSSPFLRSLKARSFSPSLILRKSPDEQKYIML